MRMSRYKVNRIGFVNFWLYDEEDFYFYDGKLLLRGSNGSGKTVTMQSFFPLIFDGNKAPERLDPFGSRDRKIEDYLLPEDFEGNENTGYLYMEFYDEDTKQYRTIGIGLRAIKNRGCEFWGFCITDNRRIGEDFLLFRERNLRIPLTKKELQTRLGTGGEFVETIKDYKAMVNKWLFGFPNVDLYTEFINLLIQIRSPKLSNSTKPSQLNQILSTVLEPLSDEDLRKLADSIDNMNRYKESLSDLQNEQKACSSLKTTYQEYNQSILYMKGENFLKYRQEENAIQKDIKENQNQLTLLKSAIEQDTLRQDELKVLKEELEHRKRNLDEKDLKNITSDLEEIEKRIRELETSTKEKEQKKLEKEDKLKYEENKIKKEIQELDNFERNFVSLIEDLTSYEEDISFDDAKFYLDDLKKENLEFKQMQSYQNTMKKRVQLLSVLSEITYKAYQKEQEIDVEKNSYAENKEILHQLEKNRTTISQELLDCANELKISFAKISEENTTLKFSQNELNNLYEIIDHLEKDLFIALKEKVSEKSIEVKEKITKEIADKEIKIKEYQTKIEELKQEEENIANVLIASLSDEDTKEYLNTNHIAYDYFFKTIRFKDEIEDTLQKQVESFLLETGLLTSLVTNAEITNPSIKTKFLKPGKITDKNLTTYLEALDTPFQKKVNQILQSISIKEDSLVKINADGKYQFAIIEGTTDKNHELRYIGEKAREKYIEKEKAKRALAINQYEKEINALKEKIISLEKNSTTLEEESKHFSYPNTIPACFEKLDKVDFDLRRMNEMQETILNTIKQKTNELKQIEEEIEENKKGYYGSTRYEVVNEIFKNTKIYTELVDTLANCFNEYRIKNDFVIHYRETILSLQDDIDSIKEEQRDISLKLNIAFKKRQTIDDLLNSDKYKDVGREYKKIEEQLVQIEEEIQKKVKIISKNETECQHIENKLKELEIEKKDKEILKNVAYKIFIDEYNLHYIDTQDLEQKDLYRFITSLKPNNVMRDITDKFFDSLNKYTQYLINYAPKNINQHMVDTNAYLNFTNDEEKKQSVQTMLEEAIRKDVVFNYLGKNVNLLELSQAIETSILEYQNLISEENRHLFEDLLINNIGSAIRTKIYQSEEWIAKVKDLMESMQTSSGLSFSLKWDSIAPLTEEEVDTKEIVAIFKKDAETLTQAHLNKITSHFKSKIRRKEEALEENERNYLEIIKEVLDYRKWFEFKLYFKRGSNEKKELTDREFHKMSGGEKAIAMYIPLFASAFAKLSNANPMAPHVIALDEAFAGVDDENIKDSFRILEQLDIDYILTSQQLWGDYETVKHLAISELHHPVGSKVVSIVKYKWDGKMRLKVNDNAEYRV